MPERMHIGRVVAVCCFVIFVCTDAYAQPDTANARPNGSRPVRSITRSEGFRNSVELSLGAKLSIDLRGWQGRPVEMRTDRWFVFDGDGVSTQRSRKKTVLIGAAIGGAVGAGGGAQALYATGGDAERWVVPGFAGIGAAVGALCGFLISLF